MNLMCPAMRFVSRHLSILLLIAITALGVHAQARRTTKKTAAKKPTATAKTTKKDTKKGKTTAKESSRKSKEKSTAKKSSDSKKEKLTAKEKAREKRSKKKVDPKKLAAERAEAARRRKAEEERRQAILAERRRREQLAREARARKLAFERGLRTTTIQNIAKDNTDGEDLQVRRAAVDALGAHAGTVVVMEAKTGKVLTIVNQDWGIRDSFKPCSTIKLVTAVGGLNEDLIDSEGNVRSGRQRLDLNDALAYSNNVYFQRVGAGMGSSKMIEYAKTLGLGAPTGINSAGESAGKLPYGNNNARIYSHGDDYEVTPLQLAVMVSAISNGGNVVVPHIPKTQVEKASYRGTTRRKVDLPQRNLQGVIPGMVGAAEYGTARRGVDAEMGVAGKTGSCISKNSWVGLFASVAPIEDPKYSVVVITRGQSERGKYAAAIAGKIYNTLRPRLERSPERSPVLFAAKPKTPTEAADLEEEEDDIDTEAVAAGDTDGRDVIVVGDGEREMPAIVAAPQPAPRKLVTKTVRSTPVKFPPVVITYDKEGRIDRPAQRPRIVKNK